MPSSNSKESPDPSSPPNPSAQQQDFSPGIGVEFETAAIIFKTCNTQMTPSQTQAAKGKAFHEHSGPLWKLTGDTTPNILGQLGAEYILDGTSIKLGTGTARHAAREVAEHLAGWNPLASAPDDRAKVRLADCGLDACNPFDVVLSANATDLDAITWSRQITAAMPLRAINELGRQPHRRENKPLLDYMMTRSKDLICVRREYFQSQPEGINPEQISEDMLGFFALVISYAKQAPFSRHEKSLKHLLPIMPRTGFVRMFNISGLGGLVQRRSLYNIVRMAACYETVDGEVQLDTRYCGYGDSLSNPAPNGQFDLLKFENGDHKLSVRDWIEGIQNGVDELREFDQKNANGQIGALRDRTEWVYGTREHAPIFEFRDLGFSTRPEFVRDVEEAEQCIVRLHTEAI